MTDRLSYLIIVVHKLSMNSLVYVFWFNETKSKKTFQAFRTKTKYEAKDRDDKHQLSSFKIIHFKCPSEPGSRSEMLKCQLYSRNKQNSRGKRLDGRNKKRSATIRR